MPECFSNGSLHKKFDAYREIEGGLQTSKIMIDEFSFNAKAAIRDSFQTITLWNVIALSRYYLFSFSKSTLKQIKSRQF